MLRTRQLLAVAFLALVSTHRALAQAFAAAEPETTVAHGDSTKPQEPSEPSIRLGGLLQVWYIGGNADPANTFRIRRAEFRITGSLSPRVGFTLLADAAKQLTLTTSTQQVDSTDVVDGVAVNQASRMLLDAYVSLLPLNHLRIEVGQQRIPFSAEGVMSAARLETAERAQFASSRERGGSFGDVRDLGLMIRGVSVPHLDYAFAVMNGSGESQNSTDRNIQKSVMGRLVGVAGALRVGASAVYGGKTTIDHPRRDRVGGEAEFSNELVTARTEYVVGADADVHREGYYELVSLRVLPWMDIVERLDSWDPDTRREDTEATARSLDALAGATFRLAPRSRAQLNVIRRSFGGVAPSATSVLVSFETSW
jgi:phosphate-selective porin O/P